MTGEYFCLSPVDLVPVLLMANAFKGLPVLLCVWFTMSVASSFTTSNQNLSYELYYYFSIYIQATAYITMTFILRLTLLILTMPLFGLSVLVGLVDGLVRRDIRRFGSGYESGFIYPHAKRTISPIFVTAWLALPFSVHPNVILYRLRWGWGWRCR